MALVIPRSKTVDLGGGHTGTRVSLPLEMKTQGLEDVRQMLRTITVRDTKQQVALGNPPAFWETDGQTGKPVDQALKRTVTVFGVTLAAAAMRLVETALRAAIMKTTRSRSGALGDLAGHWQWVYVTKGGARRISSATPPPSMSIGDRLVLMPVGVPYATNVNQAVDGLLKRDGKVSLGVSGGLTRRRRVKNKAAKAKGASVGLLEAATAQLKARPEFKQFAIYGSFTTKHKVSGELSKMQGSPMIVIRPRIRSQRMKV